MGARLKKISVARIITLSAMGCVLLVGVVYAATVSYSSNEVESATRSGNLSVISDTSASGNSAIKFGQAPASSCDVPDRVTVASGNQSTYPAYPIGTRVYVPSGLDPWGGCFPGPGNTGVPVGTQLTNYTGPCSITTANTVIDKKQSTVTGSMCKR